MFDGSHEKSEAKRERESVKMNEVGELENGVLTHAMVQATRAPRQQQGATGSGCTPGRMSTPSSRSPKGSTREVAARLTTRAPNFYTALKFGSKLPFYRPRSGRSNFSGFLSALLPPRRIFSRGRQSLTSGAAATYMGGGRGGDGGGRRGVMAASAGGLSRAVGRRARRRRRGRVGPRVSVV